MPRTKYGYVPNNHGATLFTDAKRLAPGDLAGLPAGRLVITFDGTEPTETDREYLNGRVCKQVTYRELRQAGFTCERLRLYRDMDYSDWQDSIS